MTDVVPFTTTRYRCPHCRTKTYRAKARAVAHETACFINPLRRSCKTCRHSSERDRFGYVDECAVGALSEYHCSVCGAVVHAAEGACSDHYAAKPLGFLRVMCPSWQERADAS